MLPTWNSCGAKGDIVCFTAESENIESTLARTLRDVEDIAGPLNAVAWSWRALADGNDEAEVEEEEEERRPLIHFEDMLVRVW